jgi:hypothetical protein
MSKRTNMSATERPGECLWCGTGFIAQGRGSPQRFCRPTCRVHFHSAARCWAEAELAAGRITIADFRRDEGEQ